MNSLSTSPPRVRSGGGASTTGSPPSPFSSSPLGSFVAEPAYCGGDERAEGDEAGFRRHRELGTHVAHRQCGDPRPSNHARAATAAGCWSDGRTAASSAAAAAVGKNAPSTPPVVGLDRSESADDTMMKAASVSHSPGSAVLATKVVAEPCSPPKTATATATATAAASSDDTPPASFASPTGAPTPSNQGQGHATRIPTGAWAWSCHTCTASVADPDTHSSAAKKNASTDGVHEGGDRGGVDGVGGGRGGVIPPVVGGGGGGCEDRERPIVTRAGRGGRDGRGGDNGDDDDEMSRPSSRPRRDGGEGPDSDDFLLCGESLPTGEGARRPDADSDGDRVDVEKKSAVAAAHRELRRKRGTAAVAAAANAASASSPLSLRSSSAEEDGYQSDSDYVDDEQERQGRPEEGVAMVTAASSAASPSSQDRLRHWLAVAADADVDGPLAVPAEAPGDAQSVRRPTRKCAMMSPGYAAAATRVNDLPPEAGDDDNRWMCSRCTLVNDVSSRTCDACGKRARPSIGCCRRKMSEAKTTTEGSSSPLPSSSPPSVAGDDDDRWMCSRCTLVNDVSSRTCDACGKRAPRSIARCRGKVLEAETTKGPSSPSPPSSPAAIAKIIMSSTTGDEDGEGGTTTSGSDGITPSGPRSRKVSTSVGSEGGDTDGAMAPSLGWNDEQEGGGRPTLRACPRGDAANDTATDSCESCGFCPKVRRRYIDSGGGSKERMEIAASSSSSMGMDRLSDEIVLVVMEYVPDLGALLRLGCTHKRAAELLERHDEILFGPLCRYSYGQSQVDGDNRYYYHHDQEQGPQRKWKDRCARNGVLPQVFQCGPNIRRSEDAGGCGRRGRCDGTNTYRLTDLGILSPAQEREGLLYDNCHLQEGGTDNTTNNDDEQDSNAGYFGMETIPFPMYPCNSKTCHCLGRSSKRRAALGYASRQPLPNSGEWNIIWGDFPGFRLVPKTEMMALTAQGDGKGRKTGLAEVESPGIHHAGDTVAYHVNSVTSGTFGSTRSFDVVSRSNKMENNANAHHQLALGTEHPQVMATVIYGRYIFLGFADGTVMSVTSSMGSSASVSEAPAADRDPQTDKAEETTTSCICNNVVIHSAVHAHSEEVSSLAFIYPDSFDGDCGSDYSSSVDESFDHPLLVSASFNGQVFIWPRATIDGTLDHASDDRWPIVAMGGRDQHVEPALPHLFSIAGFTVFRNDGVGCLQNTLNSNDGNTGEYSISKRGNSHKGSSVWNGESGAAGESSTMPIDCSQRSAGVWMFTGDNKGTIHVWEKRLRTSNKSISQRSRLRDEISYEAATTGKDSHRACHVASWLESYWRNDANDDIDEFEESENGNGMNGCRHICALSATFTVSKKSGKSKRLSDWEQIPALVTQIKTVHLQGHMYLLSTTKTGTLTIWECCLSCMRGRNSREPLNDEASLPAACLMLRKNLTSTKAGPKSSVTIGRHSTSTACRLFHLKKRVFVNPNGGAIEGMTVVGNTVITSGVNTNISAWDIVTGQHKGDLTMRVDVSGIVSQSTSASSHTEGAANTEVLTHHGSRYDADNVVNTAVVYVEVKNNAIVALMRHGVVFEWRIKDLWMQYYVGSWRQRHSQQGLATKPSQQGRRSAASRNVGQIQGDATTLMRPDDGAILVGVPVSDFYCHICRYSRPSGFAFECRKRSHVYCERHMLDRLGMRLGDATMPCRSNGSGDQRDAKVLDCPVCSLTCLCSKCQRELKQKS